MAGPQHAKLSPSSSYRRIKCPGSVLKEAKHPNETNEYSEMGSSAHALAEKCLKAGLFKVPDEFLGTDWREPHEIAMKFPADDYMADGVEVYLEEIERIIKEVNPPKDLIGIERRVLIQAVHLEWAWGTMDFGTYDAKRKRVIIRDYKNGTGLVEVEIEDEDPRIKWATQLVEYAAGAADWVRRKGLSVDEVDIGIVQPNAPHKDGPVRSVIIPMSEIIKFLYEVDKPAAEESLLPGARLLAGGWCGYCKDRKDCGEYTGYSLGELQTGFGPIDVLGPIDRVEIDLPCLATMTDQQLNNTLNLFELLEGFKKMAKSEALARATSGVELEDWVLTKTSPHRKYKEEAEDTLLMIYPEDKIYTRALKTPAQLEKALGRKSKDQIKSLVYKPEGTLAIAARKSTRFIVDPKAMIEEGFTATVEKTDD